MSSKDLMVNKPNHYRMGTFEVLDEMLIVFGPQKTYDFCCLNAWKYRARANYKGTLKQDLEKADRYLEYANKIKQLHPDVFIKSILVMKYFEEANTNGKEDK